jgi:hypothetical protein
VKSYRNLLAADAKISGSLSKFSFSLSSGYKKIEEGLTNEENVYILTTAKCSLYRTLLKDNYQVFIYFWLEP